MRRSAPLAIAPLIALCLSSTALAQQGLSPRLDALEAQVAALTQQLATLTQNSIVLDVDCGQQSLQAVLNQVQFRPPQVTIRVFGVCNENIVINRSLITIRGGASGAGITATTNGSQTAVRNVNPGLGSFHVTLLDLTISGGQVGVVADFGTQVQMTNCVIKQSGTGIVADHQSLVRLNNTFVEDHAFVGVSASNGAHVSINGGAVRNNAGNGMSIGNGASAQVLGGAMVSGNQSDGIGLSSGSMVAFGAATATANGSVDGLFAGISVGGGSTLFLSGGAVIDANAGNGIMAGDTSVIHKIRGEANIQITNNTRWGISCAPAPATAILTGYNFTEGTILGNGSGPHNCPKSPPPPSQ